MARQGQADGDVEDAQRGEGLRLLWTAATSPALTLVLIALAALWLLAGSQFPQGMSQSELLERTSFSWTRVGRGLGLDQVLSSWVMALLLVLGALHGLAMALRHWTERRESAGPAGREDHLRLVSADEAGVRRALEGRFGAGRVRDFAGVLSAGRGFAAEGLVLSAAGIAVLCFAALLQTGDSRAGRLVVAEAPPGAEPDPGATTVLIREPEAWVPGGPRIALACGPERPQDPLRTRTCTVSTPGGRATGPLAIGEPLEAAGIRLSMFAFAPELRGGATLILRNLSTGEVARQSVQPGASFDVTLGGGPGEAQRKVTLLTSLGPEGLLVGVDPGADDAVAVLTGAGAEEDGKLPLQVAVAGKPVLMFSWSTAGPRWAWVAGGLLLVLGALAIAAVPQLSVTAARARGGYRIRVVSWNRPWLRRKLEEELVGQGRGR